MAVDCAIHLKKHNVAFVSLWPGAVKTEELMTAKDDGSMGKDVSLYLPHIFIILKMTKHVSLAQYEHTYIP